MATKEKRRKTLAGAASGAAAGSSVAMCLQPLDVIRTRMQVGVLDNSRPPALQLITTVFRERALWSGAWASALRVGGGAFIHFGTLELLSERSSSGSAASTAFVGGAARLVAVTVLCPITTVKTRLEAGGAYRSVPEALVTIARQEGVLALWRGLWPAVFANVPFSALHLLLYRRFKEAAEARAPPSTALNFGAGGAASLIATLATHPFDVLRTRAMLYGFSGAALPPARDLVSAGVLPRLLKRPLQTALLWTLYEELKPRLTRFLG